MILPGGLLTLYSNQKFMAHLEGIVGIGFASNHRVPDEDDLNVRAGVGTSFRGVTEYVFDSWDRLQFGPSYNFERDSFGGVIGYLMVFDHFHLGVSVRTVDFTNLKLDLLEGYFPWVTFFWRI